MSKQSNTTPDYGTPISSSVFSKPEMPPPPYFKTHFINPSSFKAAINTKIDRPAASLFRLSIRLLQFAFALASGIPYAIELNHRYSASTTNFIYAEVVFGLTIMTLLIDSVTVRYYRVVWAVEFTLAILWLACFGVFYSVYLKGEVAADYMVVDLGRMERAVWCDLINTLLWLSSALFSSVMCCSGIKAAVKSKLEKRRQRKNMNKAGGKLEEMETGIIGADRV